MDKQYILDEIKRISDANGGKPPGVRRLQSEAGIKEYYRGQYWPRYNDAVRAAGVIPNEKTQPIGQTALVHHVVSLIKELRRFPNRNDLRIARRDNEEFPSEKTFRTHLGSKSEVLCEAISYCQANPGYDDVLSLCKSEIASEPEAEEPSFSPADKRLDGSVYLMKSGRFYKIGKTNSVGRRAYELAIQMPEDVRTVHYIRTDDPNGIEAYWHSRFATKRRNGEWFELTKEEVAIFRRRKFM